MIIKTAQRIQQLRKEKNMSQATLAKRLGITRNAVNLWEMAGSYPSIQSLISLSHIFNVSTDYILGVDEKKTIDISELNEKESEIITNLTEYFKSKS